MITVGSIQGGVRNNIVPDDLRMTGTMRTFDPAMKEQIHERMKRTIERIAESAGAMPLILDPTAHDRAVALTSHAPQAVSSLLAARLAHADPSEVQVSGQGLRDVTRIAASDPDMWTEILAANADQVLDVLDGLDEDQIGRAHV